MGKVTSRVTIGRPSVYALSAARGPFDGQLSPARPPMRSGSNTLVPTAAETPGLNRVYTPYSTGRTPCATALTKPAWSASVWSAYNLAKRARATSSLSEEPA